MRIIGSINLSKIDATKTKLNGQSIYGNLEKRKSSTSSRVKNCVNLTPANDNPGCITYASWRRWIYYLAKQNRHAVKPQIWSINLPSREFAYVHRTYIKTYKNRTQPSSAPVRRSSSSSAYVKHSVTTCGSMCNFNYVYIYAYASLFLISRTICAVHLNRLT